MENVHLAKGESAVEKLQRVTERVDLPSVGQAEDGQVRGLFRRGVVVEGTPRQGKRDAKTWRGKPGLENERCRKSISPSSYWGSYVEAHRNSEGNASLYITWMVHIPLCMSFLYIEKERWPAER